MGFYSYPVQPSTTVSFKNDFLYIKTQKNLGLQGEIHKQRKVDQQLSGREEAD